jgi:hypothetical protein
VNRLGIAAALIALTLAACGGTTTTGSGTGTATGTATGTKTGTSTGTSTGTGTGTSTGTGTGTSTGTGTGTSTGTGTGTSTGTGTGTSTGTGTGTGGSVDPAVKLGQPCTAVTPTLTQAGDCVGTSARWCGAKPCPNGNGDCDAGDTCDPDDYCTNTNAIAALNCTEVSGVCSMLTDYGSWCAIPPGGDCAFNIGGGQIVYMACGNAGGASATQACDFIAGCVDVGTSTICTPPSPGQAFQASCQGTRLIADCTAWGQAVQVDCAQAAIGGTACTNNACTGIPLGKACNDTVYKCATGLTCRADPSDASKKTCQQ